MREEGRVEKSKEEFMQSEKVIENVPNYHFAGFWMRFWAYLLDLIVIGSIGRIIIHPIFQTVGLSTNDSFLFSPSSIATAVVWYGYFIVMTKFFSQTLGKMVFGLKVVPLKNDILTWSTVLFREGIGRFILTFQWFTTILYVVVAFTTKKQGIHDLIADTSVVHERN